MGNEIVIATGWYSSGKPTNPHTSARCYKDDWLNAWYEFHEMQLSVKAFSLYASQCAVLPSYEARLCFQNISFAQLANDEYHTRHDWWSSVLSGAMYAYNNNLHFVYIEQDCLVKGLDKAIKWAIDTDFPIYYGYGDNSSFRYGWAENSFMFVRKGFLPTFISLIINSQADRAVRPILEMIFHELFMDYFKPWPFGHGRLPVSDWSLDCFYKQQLTDNEIDNFLAL